MRAGSSSFTCHLPVRKPATLANLANRSDDLQLAERLFEALLLEPLRSGGEHEDDKAGADVKLTHRRALHSRAFLCTSPVKS